MIIINVSGVKGTICSLMTSKRIKVYTPCIDRNMWNKIREYLPFKNTVNWNKSHQMEVKKMWEKSCLNNPPRTRGIINEHTSIKGLICDNHPLVDPQVIGSNSFPCCLPWKLETRDDIETMLKFVQKQGGDFIFQKYNPRRHTPCAINPYPLEFYKMFHYFEELCDEILLINLYDGREFSVAIYILDPLTSIYYANYPKEDDVMLQLLWEIASDSPIDHDEWLKKFSNVKNHKNLNTAFKEVALKYGRFRLAEHLIEIM